MNSVIVRQHGPWVLNSKIPDRLRDQVLKMIPRDAAADVEYVECNSEWYVFQTPFLAWDEPGSGESQSNKAANILEINQCISALVYQHEHGKIFDSSGHRIQPCLLQAGAGITSRELAGFNALGDICPNGKPDSTDNQYHAGSNQ